ncbi:MAG: AAA family ATPase [Bacteroidales bacterium]|nr:AAA family ATPase [Bacteroidales bacterium]
MTPEELEKFVLGKAEKFGFKKKTNEPRNRFNAIYRSFLNDKKSDDDNNAYFFGFIRPEEPESGVYSDFSLVIFPNKDDSTFFVSLGIGSGGFTNDSELASQPGLRRHFLKLISNDGKSFCKSSFADNNSDFKPFADFVLNNCPNFQPVVDKYQKVLPVVRYLDFSKEEDRDVLSAWIARYAIIRGWTTSKAHITAAKEALKIVEPSTTVDDYNEVKQLLEKHRFIVLQGAPGTGKTWTAEKIARDNYKEGNVLFEQFHAETSYSDFLYGIQPCMDGSSGFKPKEGILYKAIMKALAVAEKGERVLLIIDEINRANLSNVLGPVFYLFEKKSDYRTTKIKITDELSLSVLPENLDVIATMNTADRSLAVVDFALRRRFSWYTLRPKILRDKDDDTGKKEVPAGNKFFIDEFNAISEIFTTFATDEELNLQPGHSYFIAKDADEMRERLIYELLPLIKEYLVEGYLSSAKDSFSAFFMETTERNLFD